MRDGENAKRLDAAMSGLDRVQKDATRNKTLMTHICREPRAATAAQQLPEAQFELFDTPIGDRTFRYCVLALLLVSGGLMIR